MEGGDERGGGGRRCGGGRTGKDTAMRGEEVQGERVG